MTVITSTDNPRFRELHRVATSARERRKSGLTVLDGIHLVEAFQAQGGRPEILAVPGGGPPSPAVQQLLAVQNPAGVLVVSPALFRQLSTVDTPTGILALIRKPVLPPPDRPAGPCVVLEDIQDPGNLGSVLRSAAAAGVTAVYLSPRSADAWSPRVLRAGMGAHFLLHLHEGVDLGVFARQFNGRLIAAHREARQSVFDTDLTGPVGLVFGNEGAGLSRKLLERTSTVVQIPMPGGTESLNLAAAAAVCLFERVRQQALPGAGQAVTGPANTPASG